MAEERQSAHIDSLLNESDKRKRLIECIQNAYENYCRSLADSDFTVLVNFLDEFCLSWVRKNLWRSGCFSEDNEQTIVQDARMAVWKSIKKEKTASNFAFYAFGIYQKKTLDMIRKVSRKRAKIDFVSIDEPIGDGNQTIADTLADKPTNYGEEEDKRKVYTEVFHLYCVSFMNSKAFPPRCLALYYARVLPHLLEEIPDSKATSAKWAFERMGVNSVRTLTTDSEKTLQKDISADLVWGASYLQQLDDEINVVGKATTLKNLIYTSVYDKGKIEDWADYMHTATLKEASKLISSNRDLLDLIKSYVSSERILQNFLNVREGNSR